MRVNIRHFLSARVSLFHRFVWLLRKEISRQTIDLIQVIVITESTQITETTPWNRYRFLPAPCWFLCQFTCKQQCNSAGSSCGGSPNAGRTERYLAALARYWIFPFFPSLFGEERGNCTRHTVFSSPQLSTHQSVRSFRRYCHLRSVGTQYGYKSPSA